MSSALVLQRSISIREAPVSSCEWSPSGKLIAVSLVSGDIQVLDSNGKRVATIPFGDTVQTISWSQDEKYLALATSRDRVVVASVSTREFREMAGHVGGVWSAAFSPNGDGIASVGEDGRILYWSVVRGTGIIVDRKPAEINAVTWVDENTLCVVSETAELYLFRRNDLTDADKRPFSQSMTFGFADYPLSVSVSGDRKRLALGCKGGKVILLETGSASVQILEGHTDWVWSARFAMQDRVVVSESDDRTLRIWDAQSGSMLTSIPTEGQSRGKIAVGGNLGVIAIPSERRKVLDFFRIDEAWLADVVPNKPVVHYCSAKVALVGESNVGKSCLALRLAEDRYEESGTTHGMKFWPIQPEKLDSEISIPPNQKRDIVLWDMGGQDEYRLIHQLFLHDTTVALVLLDPTRGRTAFDEAEGWAKRLEKQVGGRKSAKLLVGTKLDNEVDLIDQHGLNRLINEQQFEAYYPTSAKTGYGIQLLGKALSEALDWDSLARTTRPKLFQTVREEIDRARAKDEIVLLRGDLNARVKSQEPFDFDPAAVETVISQLAIQGLISVTRLSSGEQALVLHVEHVEVYAGSVVLAAKNNPRGVPAVSESALMSADMKFPGIPAHKRLGRLQERIVLECVVQLLIEHGICIEHEGLLIFPSLFVATEADSKDEIPHSISLYYDFSGAIDNIYSSLISAITISEQFGALRLWDNRAEFNKSGQGSCGLRKVARQRGFAHLDVYVSDDTADSVRDLFISVVEEHLARHGVDIHEHVEVTCACGHQFEETTVRQRIADGHGEIGCPVCDSRTRISEGAKQARQKSPDIERRTWALRSRIQKGRTSAVERAKRNISKLAETNLEEPIRILHLSDLHVTAASRVEEMLGPICADIRNKKGGLGFDRLDYLVVSGDISDRGQQSEFEVARTLISGIISEFGLNAERCIVVPGNHDVNWEVDVYDWLPKRKVNPEVLRNRHNVQQGDGYLVSNDRYAERLRAFSEDFYHTLIQQSYPLDPAKQALSFFFPKDGLQFLTLNSCWELDEHFPDRATVNKSAIAESLRLADKLLRDHDTSHVLRIAVWHHPATGSEKIEDDAFLGQLQQAGVKIGLHGHVHEDRADVVGYVHPETQLHMIGAGSFGAGMKSRPESTPRLYNVIEISRPLNRVKVHTRCLRKDGGAWEGWAVWPGSSATERRSFYEIELLPGPR